MPRGVWSLRTPLRLFVDTATLICEVLTILVSAAAGYEAADCHYEPKAICWEEGSGVSHGESLVKPFTPRRGIEPRPRR